MYKIVWDKENNGIILTLNSDDEALNIAPRPVFYEELDLLGLNKYWKYPKSKEPLLWACERRYFYFGEKILEVKGGNIYDEPEIILEEKYKNINLVPINIDLLIEKNKSSMFLLEYEALEFINNVYRKYSKNPKEINILSQIDFDKLAEIQEKRTKIKHTVIKEDCDSFDIMPLSEAEELGKNILHNSKIEMFISSFSGGKDSQVVLDLVSRVIPPNEFSVIYSDTGYEIPPSLEIYDETKKIYQKKYPELIFNMSKNHQDILYYWHNMGSPSRMLRWCCGVMKTAPLYRELKRINGKGKQPNVLVFEGVRKEESNKRSQYNRIGKGVKHNNVINARPILEWNSTEIYLYIFLNNLPINNAYRNGLSRVGCAICPFSSDWSEHIVSKKYPNSINHFISNLHESAKLIGVSNEKDRIEYIKKGNWKMRSGGKAITINNSRIDIITTKPNFKAVLTQPKESLLTWLKVLGILAIKELDNIIEGEIKYKNKIYSFTIEDNNDKVIFEFLNTNDDIILQGLLKRVLYKTTYCIHCEACEVECPTGALNVVPKANIDSNRCIHCYKCLTFKDKGCVMANSINISESNNKSKNMKTSGIDKYSTFGLKDNWVSSYFNSYQNYFEGEHTLGVKMVPACINWLREAEILEISNKLISNTGLLVKDIYLNNPKVGWEIIWINLSYNSKIVNFYTSNIQFDRSYKKNEILDLLINQFTGFSEATLNNPLGAICNMFEITEKSILGDDLKQGIIVPKGKSVDTISRHEYKEISLLSVAYSLYKYAEKNERYNLRVSEFYNENQTNGLYREFGLSKEKFETILRSLKEEKNRVLNVELNMGLDNINLRQDLKSIDILKIMK